MSVIIKGSGFSILWHRAKVLWVEECALIARG
jgi:hypothetical protein